MNFKADWSFLEKISMGAVSSKEVIHQLNSCGHEVIELERYSTSNKIWATKIKRLRLPDLICIKCGKRIESRAKSKLDVRMSDNEKNSDRRWDAGLRDEDIVAFIQCSKEADEWVPAEYVNYFDVKSMRDTVAKSKLGDPKAPGEGAERDRIWPTTIPNKNGKICDIITSPEKTQIKVEYDDGSRPYTYSYKNSKGYNIYVDRGEHFIGKATMIAGVPTKKTVMSFCRGGYNFLADLSSEQIEVRYAGVKVLGFLRRESQNVKALQDLILVEKEHRIKLEAYASLIRLGEDVWKEFHNYAMSIPEEMYRFEYVLILGEMKNFTRASEVLYKIALTSSFEEELRSAAAWGINVELVDVNKLIDIAKVNNDNVSAHILTNLIENANEVVLKELFKAVIDDGTGGIALKVLKDSENIDKKHVLDIYKSVVQDPIKSKWCALAIGMMGREYFDSNDVQKVDGGNYAVIKNLWDYHEYSISSYREGEIEFLRKQCF